MRSERSTPTPRQPVVSAAATLIAGIVSILALALGIFAFAVPPFTAFAAPQLNHSRAASTGAHAGPVPCLIVATSACPQAADQVVSARAPGVVVVVGANWSPGAVVTVSLVPAAQPCSAPAVVSAQARASTAGVFSIELRLPAAAANGALFGLCATTANEQQTFPPGGLARSSPLRIRVLRAAPPVAPTPAAPIDGFSLAALVLAALSAGVFVLSWLRGRRANVTAER